MCKVHRRGRLGFLPASVWYWARYSQCICHREVLCYPSSCARFTRSGKLLHDVDCSVTSSLGAERSGHTPTQRFLWKCVSPILKDTKLTIEFLGLKTEQWSFIYEWCDPHDTWGDLLVSFAKKEIPQKSQMMTDFICMMIAFGKHARFSLRPEEIKPLYDALIKCEYGEGMTRALLGFAGTHVCASFHR